MTEKIQVVCAKSKQDWINGAIARQWSSLLKDGLPGAEIELVFGDPKPGADTYVHFTNLTAKPVAGARNIAYVTHVDTWWKAIVVLSQARSGVELVTMSSQTQDLLNRYAGRSHAICINPQSIHFKDQDRTAKALTFGLFFKLYPDGRKNTDAICKLFAFADHHPDTCRLVLYGKGFSALLASFPNASTVLYEADFDKDTYAQHLKLCDYVVYFGRDEGAISVVDATALDIPVLAIWQGYHADMPLAKRSQLFDSADAIIAATTRLCGCIAASQNTTDPVSLFDGSQLRQEMPGRVSIWRYLWVPFVRNDFLQRKGNLSKTWKFIKQRTASASSAALAAALLRFWVTLSRACGPRSLRTLHRCCRLISPQQAAQLSSSAISANPRSAEAYFLHGLAMCRLGLHKYAVLDFDRAIALQPDHAEARGKLAETLHMLG